MGGGEWGGLVGVGIVDGNVERLVADLPEKNAGRLEGIELGLSRGRRLNEQVLTLRPGVSMPAVTTRFVRT